MNKNNTFEEIWNKLKSSKKVLMTLHDRPDGDSLGSCTAMKYVLEKEGVEVKIVSKDNLSKNFTGFNFSKEVETGKNIEEEDLGKFDIVLLLDNGGLQDFSEQFKEKLKKYYVVDIDHHDTNSRYGNLNYVDGKASSTCSMLFDSFKEMGIEFDRDLSLRLIIGICTDTGFFKYGDAVGEMEKAVFLLKAGNLNYGKEVFDPIMSNSWELKKLHGIVLSNMKKEAIGSKVVAYSWATKEDYRKASLREDDVRLAIVCMQDIAGIDLSFVLWEIDGIIKGSFRSKEFDVTRYAEAFGGGGHKKASGFRIIGGEIHEEVSKVLKVIKEKGFVSAD